MRTKIPLTLKLNKLHYHIFQTDLENSQGDIQSVYLNKLKGNESESRLYIQKSDVWGEVL